jgi:hypothetical protein
MSINLSFDSKVIEQAPAVRLCQQLDHVLRQVCRDDMGSTKLADIQTVSDQDLNDIWKWNAIVPDAVEACVHDLIA